MWIFKIARHTHINQRHRVIAQRVGNTKSCAIRAQHAHATESANKSKLSRACGALTSRATAIGGGSTNQTPPRDHPGDGDGPNDTHEPAQRSGIRHRCGARACGGLAPPHGRASRTPLSTAAPPRAPPHHAARGSRAKGGCGSASVRRPPCTAAVRAPPRAPSGARAHRRLKALCAPAVRCEQHRLSAPAALAAACCTAAWPRVAAGSASAPAVPCAPPARAPARPSLGGPRRIGGARGAPARCSLASGHLRHGEPHDAAPDRQRTPLAAVARRWQGQRRGRR